MKKRFETGSAPSSRRSVKTIPGDSWCTPTVSTFAAASSAARDTVSWLNPRLVALCVHVLLEKLAPHVENPKLYTWNGTC